MKTAATTCTHVNKVFSFKTEVPFFDFEIEAPFQNGSLILKLKLHLKIEALFRN